MRAFLLIVLQLCTGQAAFAVSAYQPAESPPDVETIRWDRFGVLHQRDARCLAQGPDQSIWIGCVENLFRYDGYRVTELGLQDIGLRSAPLAIASVEDAVWVASQHELVRWDGDSWNTVSLLPLRDCWIRDLAVADGRLWIAHRSGLAYLDQEKVVPLTVPTPFWAPLQVEVDETRGWLWVAMKDGRVARLGVDDEQARPEWRVYGREDGLTIEGRATIDCARDGTVWLVDSHGGGVFRWQQDRWSFLPIEGLGPTNGLLAHSSGTIWIVADDQLWMWRDGQVQQKKFWWLDAGHALRFLEAQGGAVWVACGAELRFCDLVSDRWTHFRGIRFQGEDDQQRCWFLSSGKRVVCESAGRWTSYGAEDGLRGTHVALQVFPALGPLLLSQDGPTLVTQTWDDSRWIPQTHGHLTIRPTDFAVGARPLVIAHNERDETILLRRADTGWQRRQLPLEPRATVETRWPAVGRAEERGLGTAARRSAV